MADGGELQQVFELCSPDTEGFILTDYLADKLTEQLNDQDLDTIKGVLDPKRRGKISFVEFQTAINEIQESNDKVPGLPHVDNDRGVEIAEDEPRQLTRSNLIDHDEEIKQVMTSSKLYSNLKTSTPYSRDDEASSSDPENTYNEYDVPDGDDMAHSLNGDDLMESFEAVGESPSSSRLRRSTLEPVAPQDSPFRRHGSMRRSHRRSHSLTLRGVSPGVCLEDPNLDETASVTSDLEDLSEKVDMLQDHVAKLTEDKKLQAQYEAVNSEKNQLALRNHDLEERLSDALDKIEEMKRDSEFRVEEVRSKLTREHQLLLEVVENKLQNAEREFNRMEMENHEIKTLLSESKGENIRLQTKVEALTFQVMQTNEEYRKLNNQASAQRERLEEEKQILQTENETLQIQLEEALNDKGVLAERIMSLDVNHSPSTAMLSAKLANLEMENERLKSANEDLNVQLARNIVDARTLIGETDHRSIAAELSFASKDEVVEALKKQELANAQLREYLDKIILSVLERDPGILEIK